MPKEYSKKAIMKVAIEEMMKCVEFPRVGAVVAKGRVILSVGYRGEVTGRHAERVSIEKLFPDELKDSTLFTTLEPCIKLQPGQIVESCTDLIIKSGIKEVVIGILEPNGTIYCEGYNKLVENNIGVTFFNPDLSSVIEGETLKCGNLHQMIGPGKKHIPVIHSGTSMNIQFSQTDPRSIRFQWQTLQSAFNCVDLISEADSVKIAAGITKFDHITDPRVFRFESHYARMEKDMIAIVKPLSSTFYVLVQLLEIYENSILFQLQVRDEKILGLS